MTEQKPTGWDDGLMQDIAAAAIKEALAQPEQEPVLCQYAVDVAMPEYRCVGKCQYTPPQRPWVGLTGQEKALVASVSLDVHDAVHRTDAKLKEKNT